MGGLQTLWPLTPRERGGPRDMVPCAGWVTSYSAWHGWHSLHSGLPGARPGVLLQLLMCARVHSNSAHGALTTVVAVCDLASSSARRRYLLGTRY